MLSSAAFGDAEPGAVSQRMTETGVWLSRLVVSQFRCYARAELDLTAAPVVLTGPNGAGKTNLLEAISFLSPGRGLRRARLGEIDRAPPGERPSNPWAVAATVMTPQGPRDVGSGRDPGQNADAQNGFGRERRLVKVDGAAARGQQSLAEILSVVWLTPQMDGLFRESAGGRRRFLDRLVYGFDPEHSARCNAYEHALRERARLLKSGRGDAAWLVSLEESMATRGVAIAAARLDMVERLQQACDGAEGPFPKVDLELEGTVEDLLRRGPALAAEDALRDGLADSRRQDAEAGGAGLGPHRSDLQATHKAKGVAAALCSTGEQKALLIAILMAYARLLTLERGAAPLLLLDEVAAHLDAARRAALYEEILDLGAQAWLTGTDAADFEGLQGRAQFFAINDGAIRPAGAA
ncbi:DNA replication/repair protein RecF [Pelagibius sp. CAU 1746]|uniref:DNA replication/repair protein RecF n=1 Tax=Pelagibius sp. CAU 1746 TaxID=3140370 RepID=UPI00325AEE7C